MSYTVVEDYALQQQPEGTLASFAAPNKRTIPAPALVEDEHGMRILVIGLERGAAIGVHTWSSAQASGAQGIVLQYGEHYAAILTEDFIEHRSEQRADRSYLAPSDLFVFFPHPPTWREIAVARKQRAEPKMQKVEDEHGCGHVHVTGSPFVHLHAHSEFSALDGLSTVDEMIAQAVANEQPAIAITDHGVCAGHPALQKAAISKGVKPIFGMEANFVDDRRFRPMSKPTRAQVGSDEEYRAITAAWEEEQKRGRDYWHLILLAQNEVGLRNLWAIASEAHYDGFYYRPRCDWDTLAKYSEGIIASTACLRGPLSAALLNDNEELAKMRLARLNSIFDGRVWIELHTNRLPEQVELNKRLVEVAKASSNGLVVVSDSHYPTKSHAYCHKVWIATQTQKELSEEADLFVGDQDYHLMHLDEVRASLDYLPSGVVDEATSNTVLIASQVDAKIEGASSTVPIFSKKGTPEERQHKDVERLVDLCLSNWHKVQGKAKPQSEYIARFEREMDLLKRKGFCGYFLMVSEYCTWAREHGILVGPGRGSGGGSLVAYLANITEIDPVDADLIFERFLTEGRTSLPDFDVDFPSSKRDVLTQHIIERYGADHVVRVGTHIRKKNKGIVRTLGERVLASQIGITPQEVSAICSIIEQAEANSAGLGESWENMLALAGEAIEPYIEKYPELFDLAEKLVDRLDTYGKHPAGVVISPDEPLIGRLPLTYAHTQDTACKAGDHSNCLATAAWDMDVLENILHLVKFDLLTLRTIDTLQVCVDLIRERTGEVINFYQWKDEYHDATVWEEISKGRTLGAFQIETWEGVKMCKRYKPDSLAGLADVITLVRPGPQRSGLTDMYLRRRHGEEEVTFPHPLLEQTLAKTYGCILYQEDVMNVCMVLAGYDENEADKVRKILGKKKVEEAAEAGVKFVNACVERGIDRAAMEHLWSQIEEFAKYSFNRAHAYAYAVIGYWCMWLKVHYPAEFLVALLSTVDGKRIPEFVNEAKRRGFKVLPPDVNESNVGFTVVDDKTVRYGLASIKGIGEVAAQAIIDHRPYTSIEDFLARRGSKCNAGDIQRLAAIGAFDSLESNRKALEARLEYLFARETENICVHRDANYISEHNGLPCRFDWDSIPVELTSKGKPKKSQKGAPKRCTKGCWKYEERPPVAVDDWYTDEEIRERENEALGVYLSSTPFDDLPAEHLEMFALGVDIEEGPLGVEYITAAIVSSIRPREDRNGNPMAHLSLVNHDGTTFSAVCFKSVWKPIRNEVRVGQIVYLVLGKNDRGLQIVGLEPVS